MIKKYSLISGLFILLNLFIFGIVVNAKPHKYEIKWNTSTLVIPVNSNLEMYTKKVYPTLYIDGIKKDDSDFTVLKNGEYELFGIEDIDVTKPGKLLVNFRAIENKYKPGECFGYKNPVTIIIEDNEKPVVKRKTTTKIELSFQKEEDIDKFVSKKELYKSLYYFHDNYTKTEDIKIEPFIISKKEVLEKGKRLFVLEVQISFIDLNGNTEIVSEEIKAYVGEEYSYIKKTKSIIIPKESLVGVKDYKLNLKNYIEIIKPGEIVNDSIYETAEIYHNDEILNILELNKVENLNKEIACTIKFKEALNLEVPVNIKIEGEYKPILKIKVPEVIEIALGSVIDKNMFKKYIDAAEFIDGSDAYDNVKIDLTKAKTEKVGNKEIKYILEETIIENGREEIKRSEEKIYIKVIATKPPKINTDIINIELGYKEDIKNLIEVFDNTDQNVKVEIDAKKFNVYEEGTYYITAVATNSSNLKSTSIITVNVGKVNKEDGFLTFIDEYKVVIIMGSLITISGISYLTYYLIKKHKKKKSKNM